MEAQKEGVQEEILSIKFVGLIKLLFQLVEGDLFLHLVSYLKDKINPEHSLSLS